MARIRSIKPEFWTSEQVMDCSRDARVLFIGLWNFCDDAGRHKNSARQIKALIFPGDDDMSVDDVRRLIDELSANRLLTLYDAAGEQYLEISGWHHQKIDRPKPSKIPPPDEVEQVVENTKENKSSQNGRERSSNDRRTIAP